MNDAYLRPLFGFSVRVASWISAKKRHFDWSRQYNIKVRGRPVPNQVGARLFVYDRSE